MRYDTINCRSMHRAEERLAFPRFPSGILETFFSVYHIHGVAMQPSLAQLSVSS